MSRQGATQKIRRLGMSSRFIEKNKYALIIVLRQATSKEARLLELNPGERKLPERLSLTWPKDSKHQVRDGRYLASRAASKALRRGTGQTDESLTAMFSLGS
jgi:hypothetical protein